MGYLSPVQALTINLAELPEEGLALSGDLDPSVFALPEEDATPLGPLHYALHAQRFEDELLLRGDLSAPFQFTCVRTLTPFKKTISLKNAAIALETGGSGEIDATAALREEILLHFPEYPRCDEGDDPLPCEIDPRYLAVDKPVSDDVDVPPARTGDSRWDALDALQKPREDA